MAPSPERTIADIMSTPVVTSATSDTIAEASQKMQQQGVGSVVVVDGNRPVGILTERDLVRFGASGSDASNTKVSEWMTEKPGTIEPEVEVAEAWRRLAEHGYRHIPVVKDNDLKGIVTMRDLMRISQIRPVEGSYTDVPRGLKGVIVTETEIGDVRGLEGFYHHLGLAVQAWREAPARRHLVLAVRRAAARFRGSICRFVGDR